MEGGKEQNYWPGFVDALSNVVLTLVFVLVIFVFALMMASNKVEQKMKEVVDEKQKQETSQQVSMQEVTELKQKLAVSNQEIEKLKEQLSSQASSKAETGATHKNAISSQNDDMHIAIEDKKEAKQENGALSLTKSSQSVTLGFPLSVAEIDEKSATELGHVLSAMQKNMGKHKIVVRSIIGKEAYSAARRLAYYRAIGARNFLITKGGESPADITTTIVQPPQPEEGRVEIVFEKQ